MRHRASLRVPIGVTIVAAAVAVATMVPVLWLAGDGLRGEAIRRAWGADLLGLLGRTLGLCALVTVGAVTLGALLAVLVVRTDMPLGRLVAWLSAMPLAIPPFVAALAWSDLLGPGGPFDRAVGIRGVHGLDGATAVLVLTLFPYAFLVCAAALRLANPNLEDAARSLGLGPVATLARVTIPGIRAALGAGGLLVALHVLGEFPTLQLMRFDTFTTAIFGQLTSLRLDRAAASSLSLVLVGLTAAFLAGESVLRRGRREVHRARPPTRLPLGRARIPALVGALAVAACSLGLPLGWLLYQATRGARAPEGLAGGLASFSGETLPDFVRNSLLTAGGATLLAVLVAIPVAIVVSRHSRPVAVAIGALTQSGYAVPGVVIALVVISMTSGPLWWLSGSVMLLVLVHAVRFLPEAVQAMRGSIDRVPASLEEAARSLGRGPSRAMLVTTIRLASGGAVTGGLLVFLSVMKEVPATLLLRPPGFDTLAVRVWTDAGEGLYRDAAPAALALVGLCAVALIGVMRRSGTVEKLSRRGRGGGVGPVGGLEEP